MGYKGILKAALPPSILLLILSLVSVALTTHYWITEDWVMSRNAKVPTQTYDERLQRYKTDDTIVWFTEADTDATIVSGCLNLTAAVVALIAWSTLRKPGMDSQYAAGKRRFWIIAVVATTISGAASAVASLVLHYTEKGPNEYGCTSQTLMMTGQFNTNQYCTREQAACNFLPKFIQSDQKNLATITCNETVVVKWMQVILAINAIIVLVLFSIQARRRRILRQYTEAKEQADVQTREPTT